jgi:type II secretory pathway component GspD/PulD (secretin)
MFTSCVNTAETLREQHPTRTMKTAFRSLLVLLLCGTALLAQEKGATRLMTPAKSQGTPAETPTFSSLDRPGSRSDQEVFPAEGLKFLDAEIPAVLMAYQELSGRTVVRSGALSAAKISVQNQTPLTRREALQLLDTVLAENGITMIIQGTKLMKAVPTAQVAGTVAPMVDLPPDQLPESSTYITYMVRVKNRRPSDVGSVLQQFSKMPNSIIALRDDNVLILRDYSINVRRMLEMLARIDREEPAE